MLGASLLAAAPSAPCPAALRALAAESGGHPEPGAVVAREYAGAVASALRGGPAAAEPPAAVAAWRKALSAAAGSAGSAGLDVAARGALGEAALAALVRAAASPRPFGCEADLAVLACESLQASAWALERAQGASSAASALALEEEDVLVLCACGGLLALLFAGPPGGNALLPVGLRAGRALTRALACLGNAGPEAAEAGLRCVEAHSAVLASLGRSVVSAGLPELDAALGPLKLACRCQSQGDEPALLAEACAHHVRLLLGCCGDPRREGEEDKVKTVLALARLLRHLRARRATRAAVASNSAVTERSALLAFDEALALAGRLAPSSALLSSGPAGGGAPEDRFAGSAAVERPGRALDLALTGRELRPSAMAAGGSLPNQGKSSPLFGQVDSEALRGHLRAAAEKARELAAQERDAGGGEEGVLRREAERANGDAPAATAADAPPPPAMRRAAPEVAGAAPQRRGGREPAAGSESDSELSVELDIGE